MLPIAELFDARLVCCAKRVWLISELQSTHDVYVATAKIRTNRTLPPALRHPERPVLISILSVAFCVLSVCLPGLHVSSPSIGLRRLVESPLRLPYQFAISRSLAHLLTCRSLSVLPFACSSVPFAVLSFRFVFRASQVCHSVRSEQMLTVTQTLSTLTARTTECCS